MKLLRSTSIFSLLLAGSLACLPVRAECLWQVSDGDNALNLVGSFHLLPTGTELAPAVQQAYRIANEVMFETDITGMESPQAQQQFAAAGMLSGGETLADRLPPDLLAEALKAAEGIGFPKDVAMQMRPWMLAVTLAVVEMQQRGFDANAGADQQLIVRAIGDDKPVLELETLQQQIDFFGNMSPESERDMMASTLDQLERSDELLTTMFNAWQQCDVAKLDQLMVDEMNPFPEIQERLLFARNRNWLPQVLEQLRDPGQELVVVGVGHLVGNKSLIDLLRDAGVKVELVSQ